jgi:hypothetical protein
MIVNGKEKITGKNTGKAEKTTIEIIIIIIPMRGMGRVTIIGRNCRVR